MIERQRGNDGLASFLQKRLQPSMALLQICKQVAVGQHGALRNARRSTGILQEGNVVVIAIGWVPPGRATLSQS